MHCTKLENRPNETLCTGYNMKISVQYFAIYQELMGVSSEEITLEEGTTISNLFSSKTKDLESPQSLLESTVFALNSEYVEADTVLSDGDELVFIPPVSGG